MKIGTHSGRFHCDEVLGVSLLQYLAEYKDAEIIRSRDPTVLADCDVVIDVGGVFDHKIKRYDHHQADFSLTFYDGREGSDQQAVTKLSSAGLVYRFYGKRIIEEAFGVSSSKIVDVLYDRLYKNFIESVDAIDNGVSVCDSTPRYSVSTDLASRVARLNPSWHSRDSPTEEFERFTAATSLARQEFKDQLDGLLYEWWPARDIVKEALLARKEVHASGQIICLGSGCPFMEHLYELEEELPVEKPILYALFKDGETLSQSSWRIRAIGVHGEKFLCRRSLPQSLRGLRDEELSKAAGISGLIFIHSTGFIGGATTPEAALALAVLSLGDEDSASNEYLPK
eukprot:GHVQ01021613.1.p1 GENE.GHVQ01021613.1~~GHVQ01021613.1.p1  ORF type:complete len:341 (-),score=52.86 GHVQ01021613.1:228-1250(-)